MPTRKTSTASRGAAALAPALRGHIVTIRNKGEVVAYQLRAGDGGPGRSWYFPLLRLGGARKALRAAREAAAEMGLVMGGRASRPPSAEAGVRFEWTRYAQSEVLYVVASWTDRDGRHRGTRYSVARHGAAAALDMAIERRTSAGAPGPNRARLLRELRAELAAYD